MLCIVNFVKEKEWYNKKWFAAHFQIENALTESIINSYNNGVYGRAKPAAIIFCSCGSASEEKSSMKPNQYR